jgi:hypothetical protein
VSGVGQSVVRLIQLGGALGRHLLKLLTEVLDLVGMVTGDLRTEGGPDLLVERVRRMPSNW